MSWRARAWKAWKRRAKAAGVNLYALVTRELLDRMRVPEKDRRRLMRAYFRRGDQFRAMAMTADSVEVDQDAARLRGQWVITQPRYQGVLVGIDA